MEAYLDDTDIAIKELSDALDKYEKSRDKYCKLEEYYGSKEWRADFEADEAGSCGEVIRLISERFSNFLKRCFTVWTVAALYGGRLSFCTTAVRYFPERSSDRNKTPAEWPDR